MPTTKQAPGQVARSLRSRERVGELMDDPLLDERDHRVALAGLARLNLVSGAARVVWSAIRPVTQATSGPLSVLDVATGGGDVVIGLWHLSRAAGCVLELTGADLSETALAVARERAETVGVDVCWRVFDALRASIPPHDIVTCSLFLHHLDDADAAGVLRRLATATRRRLIVNDLVRGPLTYGLVSAAAQLVTRSPVVHTDAARSVRAAFTPEELRMLARDAGLAKATVRRVHPCRQLLVWDRP